MAAQIDSDIVHYGNGEAVSFTAPDADGIDVNPMAMEVPEDGPGHGRAARIYRAIEENGGGKICNGACPSPSPPAVQGSDQRKQSGRCVEADIDPIENVIAHLYRALVV